MSGKRAIRIGIDVGGTFTHAVAIDGNSLELIGKVKVPTTHKAAEGVAKGIIEALQTLLSKSAISPEQVTFIAHSTTQATNALLEGDVAKVGILGMGAGSNAWLAKLATNPKQIALAPGKFLKTCHRFVDTTNPPEESVLRKAFEELKQEGAEAFAISEAFSVDNPANEKRALTVANEMGLMVSAGSEISQLYGLSIRTRTAVLNSSMLPKMLEAATLTEKCVLESGIKAPLMIMRSDGGVMDIASMRKRPILTMLSGPAAGVAAAMMFLHISNGIFLEVGGTSTDVSVIVNGRAQVKSAEIGGHKLFMRTLDVHTLGVAGGSMSRTDRSKIIDVGPRSAHIAGLQYMAFSKEPQAATVKLIAPRAADPPDYITVAEGEEAPAYCLTTTCAANLLGFVPEEDCAFGNAKSVQAGFDALGKLLQKSGKVCAEEILAIAASKCKPLINRLLSDRKLDRNSITLYGGGGGAASIVPYLAKQMDMKFVLAESADVISAIGVALALLQETIERQVINPTKDDVLRIKQEAEAAVEKVGAAPSSIQVFVEIDPQTSTIRATATGATSLTEEINNKRDLNENERLAMVASSIGLPSEAIELTAQTDYFQAYSGTKMKKSFLGLINTKTKPLRVLDASGIIRFQASNAEVALTNQKDAEGTIAELSNRLSTWGDAGRTIPNIILLAGTKIFDLSGLMMIEQVLPLARAELENLPGDSPVIVVASQH
jgi:N-methylhydantoinase A/oxoprolinase/acetone carboxylase beta subunit